MIFPSQSAYQRTSRQEVKRLRPDIPPSAYLCPIQWVWQRQVYQPDRKIEGGICAGICRVERTPSDSDLPCIKKWDNYKPTWDSAEQFWKNKSHTDPAGSSECHLWQTTAPPDVISAAWDMIVILSVIKWKDERQKIGLRRWFDRYTLSLKY